MNFLNLIVCMHAQKSPMAHITCNDEKLDAFLLRSGPRQGCSPSRLLFSIAVEILANGIWKGYKRYTDWEGRKNFVGKILWNNLKESTASENLCQETFISNYHKLQDTKLIYKSQSLSSTDYTSFYCILQISHFLIESLWY